MERPSVRASGDIAVFDPDEVRRLVRAASEQDAAIYLTAAFTGLRRGELIALRWRETDFARSTIRLCGSYSGGQPTTPISGQIRSVPMAPDVAEALRALWGHSRFTDPDDLVFAGVADGPLDGSALRRRYGGRSDEGQLAATTVS